MLRGSAPRSVTNLVVILPLEAPDTRLQTGEDKTVNAWRIDKVRS